MQLLPNFASSPRRVFGIRGEPKPRTFFLVYVIGYILVFKLCPNSQVYAAATPSTTGVSTKSSGGSLNLRNSNPNRPLHDGLHYGVSKNVTASSCFREAHSMPLKHFNSDSSAVDLASAISNKPDFALIKSLGHQKLDDILEAHAILGSLAWIVIIPTGAIVFALLKVPRLFYIHSAIQTIGLLCLIPSFVLGVIIGKAYGKLYVNAHTIIGTILFIIALLQPVWGILQHRIYIKTGKTTIWALIHRWIGRAAITLAIINGGLGFILTKGFPSYSAGGLKAYISVSAIMWSIYVAAAIYEALKYKNANLALRARHQSTDSTLAGDHRMPSDWREKA